MSGRLPDFVIIGAMKCGTSTLHDQLGARSGLFMSEPKEPNFFSDDDNFARGLGWYAGLFEHAAPGQLCGESSTHYTKLPTYPRTVERMRETLPAAKLIYVMRDPIDRIVSQYIHEWTQREVRGSLDKAVRGYDRYAWYSSYAAQLEPYMRTWSTASILLVGYERMISQPQEELERICRFLGDPSPEPPAWIPDRGAQNVSAERLRKSGSLQWILQLPGLPRIKSALPGPVRELAKRPWRMTRRPELAPSTRRDLEQRIDTDLARLGGWLGRELSCEGWASEVLRAPLDWARPVGGEEDRRPAGSGSRG